MATAEKGALTQALRGYRYRSSAENQLAPIAIAAAWPWLAEQYGLGWGIGIIPRVLRALVWQRAKQLRFALQRVGLRFEKLAAYSEFFPRGATPDFAETPEAATPEIAETPRGATDAAFAFYRIAGPNPLMLQQELDRRSKASRAR